MKKIIFLVMVIFSVLLIYLFTKNDKNNCLVLGISVNDSLIKKDSCKNYNLDYINNKYRITDIINDIKYNKEINNKGLQNYIIKSDLIILNIGQNELRTLNNSEDIYSDLEQILNDLEQLFSIMRKFSKEKIVYLKNDINNDYIESRIKSLCEKYKIIYVS